MSTPFLNIRAGHPDFLDLEWSRPIKDWLPDRTVDLPTGIHRHPVVFVPYVRDIYAIKELPLAVARHEYSMLRGLRELRAPSVEPVGLVERPWLAPQTEGAGAVITRYLDYTMSYRELLEGEGFGARRSQMLNAFANLLVELHLLGCFWGDASLSNVLYRYDAETLQVTMVDGETVALHDSLSDGQRNEDIEIMIVNVAGGMADIAAQSEERSQSAEAVSTALDHADMSLGEDIAQRYNELWAELNAHEEIAETEGFRIEQRISRLNDLGYEVDDVIISPPPDGGKIRFGLKVGGRRFHSSRLRDIVGIDATEGQARVILGDLRYRQAYGEGDSPSGKAVAAVQWRVGTFEPILERIREVSGPLDNPVQGYADFLNHRHLLATEAKHDIDDETAFSDWVEAGRPGYPLD
ncbi:MAG: DUF4032 domain-containing protein [Acidimicrobiia bacterium]|nr:DUF4032 domain-containing protein [Acidimicrobiia bacterium]MDH3469818.1 DUF4032 domain-containing protein [Acidimicrobiia bacterium]